MTARTTASTKPSGKTSPWIVQLDQVASSGSVFPWGKTFASKPVVSRRYEWLSKMRYSSTNPTT